MEIFKKEKTLENYLEILTRKAFADLFTAEKSIDRKEFIKDLRSAIENTGEYFDEIKVIEGIESFVRSKIEDENLRNEVLKTIIETDKNGNKRLNEEWRDSLEDYFRRSLEKKGINFRDQIKDSNELRAWLYLTIKDENIKNQFRHDFERALSQREIIYFRLWSPTIVNGLKYLILGEAKPKGFKEGEFVKELQSYIEDLQKGKNRITFWFDENILPEELKNRNETELKNLGIEKRDNVYEFYITPDQIADLILNLVTGYTESIKEQTELAKLFQNVKDTLKDLEKKVPRELKSMLGMYGSLIIGLEERYFDMLESGASKEELDKIKKSLEEINKSLEEMKKDVEAKKPSLEIKSKTSKWLKEKGSLILSGIGLWGLAIGWFLPLWLISKMYSEIEKGSLIGKGEK